MIEQQLVGALIDDYVARGVFRGAALPSNRAALESYGIVWFRGQVMRLDVDARRGRVCLQDVLPPIAPRSRIDRDLRNWLRSRESPDLPAHRSIDPLQFKTELRRAGGRLQLTVTSRSGAADEATHKLLRLVNELYLDFLAAPGRYDWIVATFDLDPDQPRWP